MGFSTTDTASSKGAIRPFIRSGEFGGYRPSGSIIGLVGSGREETASARNVGFCKHVGPLFGGGAKATVNGSVEIASEENFMVKKLDVVKCMFR